MPMDFNCTKRALLNSCIWPSLALQSGSFGTGEMAHSGRHLLCKPGDLGLDCHHLPKKLSVAMQTTIAVLGVVTETGWLLITADQMACLKNWNILSEWWKLINDTTCHRSATSPHMITVIYTRCTHRHPAACIHSWIKKTCQLHVIQANKPVH